MTGDVLKHTRSLTEASFYGSKLQSENPEADLRSPALTADWTLASGDVAWLVHAPPGRDTYHEFEAVAVAAEACGSKSVSHVVVLSLFCSQTFP